MIPFLKLAWTFVLTPWGRIGMAGFGIAAFFGLFAFDQQSKGAAKAVAKIEKATDDAISKAHAATARSRSGGGVLNPNYRD